MEQYAPPTTVGANGMLTGQPPVVPLVEQYAIGAVSSRSGQESMGDASETRSS